MCGLIVCSSAWQPTLRFDLREHRLQWGERVVGAPTSRKRHYSVLQRGILERHTQSEPNHTRALCCPVQPAKVCALPHQRAGCHTGRRGQPHERDPEHHHTGRRWVFDFNEQTLWCLIKLFFLYNVSYQGEYVWIWWKMQSITHKHFSFLQLSGSLLAGIGSVLLFLTVFISPKGHFWQHSWCVMGESLKHV